MTDRSLGRGALGVALLRLLLLPIVFFIERSDPPASSPAADMILLAACVYAALALALTRRASPAPLGGWSPYAIIDLIFLGLLAWQSGGAFSEVRVVLAALPFVAAFVGHPRSTATFATLVVLVYIIAAEAPAGGIDHEYVASEGLLMAWSGTLAVLLSFVITLGRAQVLNLTAELQRLLDDTQNVTERERQRLAYRLHDDAIQSLHAAHLQLGRLERGNQEALAGARAAIANAVKQLRSTVADLRPADPERVGLSNALHETALRLLDVADTTTPRLEITVAPEVEDLDYELWFAIAREILSNAIIHSHAAHITLTLTLEDGHVTLTVVDDGQGIDEGRHQQARREGHIGLAACAERVAARGGTLDLTSTLGRGTSVVIILPIGEASACFEVERTVAL